MTVSPDQLAELAKKSIDSAADPDEPQSSQYAEVAVRATQLLTALLALEPEPVLPQEGGV